MQAHRQQVISALKNIALLNANVGPTELCCSWFDDCYFPDSPSWKVCFSQSELEAMHQFNEQFSLLAGSIELEGQNWQKSNKWEAASMAANLALEAFNAAA